MIIPCLMLGLGVSQFLNSYLFPIQLSNAFVSSIPHVFRVSFVLRSVCLFWHYFKITTWSEIFSYEVVFLFLSFGFFRDFAHLLRSAHFCKVVGFSAIFRNFAQCQTAFLMTLVKCSSGSNTWFYFSIRVVCSVIVLSFIGFPLILLIFCASR